MVPSLICFLEVHLGTATVAQTGSLLFRRMVFGRWADCQSATQQTASLRYEPASNRIDGSAKMRALSGRIFPKTTRWRAPVA